MTTLATARDKLATLVQAQHSKYEGDADRPLGGYTMTMAVYASVVSAVAASAKAAGVDIPDGLTSKDITLLALATHKLSSLLAKDPVTSPLRAPVTAYQGTSGPAELHEEVRGSGAQKTVGELITCPFCTGIWVATGFTAGMIFLPKTTRLAMGTLAGLAGADLPQFGHAWLQQASEG
ncbi:MAG TPA: DUF1360 domain-containing protein [Trebonia sp.]|nr:DUF1360 domain-containing protein [Trebonia sp.]